MRSWILALLWMVGTALPTVAHAQTPTRILDVRVGTSGETTRVVVESDNKLNYNIFSLDTGAPRVVLDFPRVRWSVGGLTAESGSGPGGGQVSGFRYAHNTASTSRLVLDLGGPAIVAHDFQLQPENGGARHRTIIELVRATPETFAEHARMSLELPRAVAQAATRKPLIVIDPGHGGKDPGAISAKGVFEKDITLGIALELRDELLKTKRYEVALTRSNDTFLELDDRVTRARNLGADLFISLHADAGPRPQTRGASVYTLSPEGEKRAEAARQKNDWVLAIETDTSRSREVNQILADLVQRDTKNQSARFAQMLVPALAQAGWPVLHNTHRQRGFFVLLSPDVPAVLLEMGFLTNTEDAAMLASDSRRKNLVRGVVEAIDVFFEGQPSLVAKR